MRGGLGFRGQSLPDLRWKWGVGTGQAGEREFGVGDGREHRLGAHVLHGQA